MTRTLSLTTSEAEHGQRLDAVIGAWLPAQLGRPLSKTAVRRLIMAGAVRRDGHPLRRPGLVLSAGVCLTVVVRLDRLEQPFSRTPAPFTAKQVLYEDDVVIAVDKPAGVPTHATVDPHRPHLVGLVQQLLAARGQASGALAIHQRLDRDTSGVVLFAKDASANAGLAASFAQRRVAKTYHALTARPGRLPPRSWSVTSSLGARERSRAPRVVSVPGGRRLAHTEFETLEELRNGLLVEARPLTGRKHQIRAHLAEAGLPILGDTIYGGRDVVQGLRIPRLMLHALRLALPHPVTGAPLVIESAYPPDFERVLEALRDFTRRPSLA